MMKKFALKTAVLMAAVTAFSAHALQTIDVSDGSSKQVKISFKEMTRLSLKDGKIINLDFIDGELDVKKNADDGDYIFLPNVNKPINVFAKTSTGKTHALILQPTDIPLETVILVEGKSNDTTKRTSLNLSKADSLEDAVRKFMTSMARGESPFQYEVRDINSDVNLWEEAKFVFLKKYTGPDFIGEHYRLTNISKKQMRLAEQELYRNTVQAVAIEQQVLNPGETTNVFIVRMDNEDGRH